VNLFESASIPVAIFYNKGLKSFEISAVTIDACSVCAEKPGVSPCRGVSVVQNQNETFP